MWLGSFSYFLPKIFCMVSDAVTPNARGKLRRKERSDWREPKAQLLASA